MNSKQGQYPVRTLDEFYRLSRQDILLNEVCPLLPQCVTAPKQVLDVACGTGGWLRNIAQAFPQAQCCGVDISPPLLDHARALADSSGLKNVKYVQGDFFNLPKSFPTQKFDLVQMRVSTWFVGARKKEVFAVIKDLLQPGGVFRIVEFEQPYPTNSLACKRYASLFFAALEKRGVQYFGTAEFPMMLSELDFHDIRLEPFVVNLSTGAENIQALRADMQDQISTVGRMIVSERLLTEDAFEEMRQAMITDMNALGFGMLAYFLSVTGQK